MRDNLNRLQSTLSTINAVLEDAEERSVKENDRVLRDWLTKLKEAAYDADDLLDDFRIEAQRKKLELDHRRPILKKVRFFFTCSNPVVFRVKMSRRINEMRGRLDAIAAERTSFHLEGRGADHRRTIIRERETWSKFDETTVICGRDDDVETIMSLLTEEKDHGPNINVSIVSIVGMGGLGKTTLAQLVFKMVEKKLFDLRIWVYVSQDFDPIRIAREAIASATGERCDHEGMESVGKRLVDILKDTRFLLVLDDVWNDNRDKWESTLKPMLNDGKKGSRILVTTRDQNVALMMGGTTGRLHTLRGLSDDACWELFKQRAFVQRQGGDKDEEAEEINPQLVKIGKEILKKCGGVPLAAKTLGGIMLFKKTTAEWEAVRDDDIWKLAEVNKGVIASLRLSYMQLSPQVKQCFAYCSMFPKGRKIGKEDLIDQWIAQGFIPLSLQSNEIGEEYLGSLLRLSFLQENNYGFWCTMHDLVHDLAASVAGDDVVTIKTEAEMAAGIPKGCRYATLLHVYSPPSEAVAKSFKKVRALRGRKIDLHSLVLSDSDTGSFGSNLRSLVLSDTGSFDSSFNSLKKFKKLRYLSVSLGGDKTVLLGSLCSLESLQVLHLSDCFKVESIPESIGDLCDLRSLRLRNCLFVESYPDSVGNLEYLRMLDLSWNRKLKQLPDSVGRLQNLRTLNLSCCLELQALPESVTDLVHLEKMDLSSCLKLEHLPDSIGRLQNLRTLNLSNCNELRALHESVTDLVHLEEMDLSNCKKLKQLPDLIGRLRKLRRLNIHRCIKLQALPESVNYLVHLEEMDLSSCEKLEQLPLSIGRLKNLRTLNLFNCNELRALPESVTDLVHLDEIDLSSCEKLEQLPDSIARLQNIRTLNISNCNELRALPESVTDLVHLEEMDLSSCEKLKHLPDSIARLQNLRTLNLSNCNELRALPESVTDLVHLDEMDLSTCEKLEQLPDSIGRLQNLRTLNLSNCNELRALPESVADLVHLEEMDLSNCKKLEQLPELIGRLKNLPRLNLSRCSDLRELPESVTGMVHLEEMDLSYCKKLEQLPYSIGRLQNLPRLNLSYCEKLQALPESVSDLVNLKEMDLSYCKKLEQLPASIGRLKNLRRLKLSFCNKLKALPESVTDLAHLEEMDLWSCLELQELPKGLGIKMKNLRHLRNKGCSTMKGMPIGLAQLKNLRTLSVFIVGEEEEGFCSIASLGHMNQLEGELTIKKLERLVRNPFDAKKANLEKRENLRTVAFEWSSRDRAEVGDDTATAAATVFENLLPPPGIKVLTIDGYLGTKYPSWMMQIGSHYSFLKLTNIKFVDHKRCDRLPPLGVLPSLERLQLEGMHGIRTIVDELNGGVIGSASSLKEISFIDMPNFEEWTTARLISNGQPVTIFPNLKRLTISGCSLLKAQPCLPPSIERLVFESSNEELLSSKSLGMLSSMRELTIKNCSAQFEWQGLLHLTGLTVLCIEECSVLSELPECIGDLQSLQSLGISRCDRLTRMPHFLRRLTDLGSLIIEHCPQLESRCKKETGEDWSNISHIPDIEIYN